MVRCCICGEITKHAASEVCDRCHAEGVPSESGGVELPVERLVKCPFCGGSAKETLVFGRAGVMCTQCPAYMRSQEVCGGSVVEAWNTRAFNGLSSAGRR